MKYRKRPVVVDAVQWFPGKNFDLPYVHEEAPDNTPPMFQIPERDQRGPAAEPQPRYSVITAHGQRAYLAPGDWIIAEPDGRGYYPCKDSIFRTTYEPVE